MKNVAEGDIEIVESIVFFYDTVTNILTSKFTKKMKKNKRYNNYIKLKGRKIMDRITSRLLDQFCELHEIESLEISKQYEHYVNYSITSNYVGYSFDLDNTSIGNGGDTGIDGIVILVNGLIIDNSDQIEEMIGNKQKLDVEFIFIQTKSGEKFEKEEINNFGYGVIDFFSEKPKLERNEDVQRFSHITETIFEYASELKDNPDCHLYYVTSGEPNKDDRNHNAVIASTIETLESMGLFDELTFILLGSKEINRLYRKSSNPLEAEFVFRNKINLENPLPGISEVYFGALPIDEFKKIVLDGNGSLKLIFEDNVRDSQGENNSVNKSILDTLKGDNPELFPVLNNGITIVAKEKIVTRSKFILKDYQIVNGCQTTNMLFNTFDHLEEKNIDIPVKIIITTNEDIKNEITVATNNQIAVKREQLQAMTEFQKGLEDFYNTFDGDLRLFYERRSGQYRTDNEVKKSRIITMQIQIKAFSAMFEENPHRVTSYFGGVVKKLIESSPQIIFNKNHPYELYYAAGLGYYRLENLFKKNEEFKKYKRVRFFIIMIFRYLIQKSKLDLGNIQNPQKAKNYCKPILKILSDENKAIEYFTCAFKLWDQADIDLNDKEILKMASTTEKIKKILNH